MMRKSHSSLTIAPNGIRLRSDIISLRSVALSYMAYVNNGRLKSSLGGQARPIGTLMYRILMVEDNAEHLLLVERAFPEHRVVGARSIDDAKTALEKDDFDLLLLDVQLPDGDGYQFCASLQNDSRFGDIPIIFITAKAELPNKLLGFSVGADDYIVKPFQLAELKARINSRLRRVGKERKQEEWLRKGDLKVSLSEQRCYLNKDGKEEQLQLSSFELKLLVYFMKHQDHVLSREQLLNAVWGENVAVIDRTVDTHICKLRKVIKQSSFHISSVHRVGYRFSQSSTEQLAA